MKTRELLIVTGILVSALFGASALATETEHIGIDILPAPGKVSIDGKIDDWDLSGGIFVLGRAELLGIFDTSIHDAAIFAEPGNGRLYLAVAEGHASVVKIFERLGDGQYALRSTIDFTGDETVFWADENGDQKQQPNEVYTYPKKLAIGDYLWEFNVNQDLSICANAGDRGLLIKVNSYTDCGAPKYNLDAPQELPPLGGSMISKDGKKVLSGGEWYTCYDVDTGKVLWKYPNPFSGVHGSHVAPPPQPGLIRGAFGIVGNAKLPEPVGNIWAINTNVGEWHVLTEDGFYLTRLFQGDPLKMKFPEKAVPGAVLDDAPPGSGGEDFGGHMRQCNDGGVYIQAGKTALWNVKVVGLDKVRSIPGGTISISNADVQTAEKFREEQLQAAVGTKVYIVKKYTVVFTGNLDRDFQDIISFAKQKDSSVRAAAAYDDTNLYLGWEVKDTTPWVNGADAPEYMYARGDTVDFQLGTDPNADELRTEAVKGDLRLSIGNFKGTPTAVLYRKVSDQKNPKIFSSGLVKNYVMDSVTVLKEARIEVKKGDRWYVVEAAIPLASLGLQPFPGLKLIGDFGATHGTQAGDDTALRTYWSNQCTGLVNDEVFELKMEPRNWGQLQFR